METKQLTFERTYNAPIERVWKALTDKEQMKVWYFNIPEFQPEPGFEFTFQGEKDCETFLHLCKVIAVDPPTKLSYTWAYDGYPGESLVTFHLEKLSDQQTILTLTHQDIDTFPADNDFFAPSNFTEGWTFILGTALMDYVERAVLTRSIEIGADVDRIWNVLLAPNKNWASAFGEGTVVKDTDWQLGSPVIWTDASGGIGASGKVTSNINGEEIEIAYFDDEEIAHTENANTGDYIERYKLSKDSSGKNVLTIEVGELSKSYFPAHSQMWENALQLIKESAES